jgi:hypothetical protein
MEISFSCLLSGDGSFKIHIDISGGGMNDPTRTDIKTHHSERKQQGLEEGKHG